MAAEFITRADALRSEYVKLEGVKGSGYHDDDKNPANPLLYLAPQRNGLPRMSESVVAFFDHGGNESVEFFGPDAERAHAALLGWLKKNGKGDPSNKPGTERKLILRLIPRMELVRDADGHASLSIRLCDWNDVLYALEAAGVSIAGLPLEE